MLSQTAAQPSSPTAWQLTMWSQ